MDQHRSVQAFCLFHHFYQQRQVMPVYRPQISKAKFLKEHARHQQILDAAFHPLRRICHTVADRRNPSQEKLNIVLGPGVGGRQAHFRQIMRHRTDIFADRHLVVIEDHDQVPFQMAGMVQPFERQAAGQ